MAGAPGGQLEQRGMLRAGQLGVRRNYRACLNPTGAASRCQAYFPRNLRKSTSRRLSQRCSDFSKEFTVEGQSAVAVATRTPGRFDRGLPRRIKAVPNCERGGTMSLLVTYVVLAVAGTAGIYVLGL